MGIAIVSPWNAGTSRLYGFARQRIRDSLLIQLDSPGIAVATCLLITLSAVDAAMTMTLLPLGAVEYNPLMRVLIERDPQLFVHVKLLITAACALTLAVLSAVAPSRQNLIAGVLQGMVGLYFVLVGYEIFLLQQLT